MLKRAASLARLFLFAPARAADESMKEESLLPCLAIYIAFTAAYLLFFMFKPFDFPDQNAAYPREPQTLMFWFKVMLWQPPLEAVWIAFLLGLVAWFRTGSLAVKLTGGALWAALPFVLIGVYAAADTYRATLIAKVLLAIGPALWIGLFIPLWRRMTRSELMPVITFMLGVNAIGILILAPMIASIFLGSPGFFMGSQAAGGFWILGCGTLGLRRLTGLRLPRAFMAVLLSMFFQIAVAFTLYLLHIVPKDILKALLYA